MRTRGRRRRGRFEAIAQGYTIYIEKGRRILTMIRRYLTNGARDRSGKRRDVEARLAAEGWVVVRVGPGDHVHCRRPGFPGRVTIDRGSRDFPIGTLR